MANKIYGKTIAETYKKLLFTKDNNGLEGASAGSERIICTDDGDGVGTGITESCLSVGKARVGIGVTAYGPVSPDETLHLYNSEPTTLKLERDDSNNVNIEFKNTAGSRWFGISPQEFFAFGTGQDLDSLTTTAVTIDPVQKRLGIGTLTPDHLLHLSGASGATAINLERTNTTSTGTFGSILFENDAGTDMAHIKVVGNSSNTRGNIQFGVGHGGAAETKMILLSDGNVGIGTTEPTHALHVLSSDNTGVNNVAQFEVDNGDVAITLHQIHESSKWTFGLADGHESMPQEAFIISRGNNIHTDPKFTILEDSGNVGIGTIAPAAPLSVCQNTAGAQDIAHFRHNDTTEDFVIHYNGTDMQFRDEVAGAGDLWMTFKDGGNVGIGTTSPTDRLHVVGIDNANFSCIYMGDNSTNKKGSGLIYAGNGMHVAADGVVQIISDANSIASAGNADIIFGYGSDEDLHTLSNFPTSATMPRVTTGKFEASSGDFYTNDSSVSSLSDVRIKKDVADLTDGLSIVNQLRPRTYKLNGKGEMGCDDGVTRYGFVADEVLPVASHYVKIKDGVIDGVEVDDLKSMALSNMIPMMVKAIQELSDKITALENA